MLSRHARGAAPRLDGVCATRQAAGTLLTAGAHLICRETRLVLELLLIPHSLCRR
jgi:hypothetical protein